MLSKTEKYEAESRSKRKVEQGLKTISQEVTKTITHGPNDPGDEHFPPRDEIPEKIDIMEEMKHLYPETMKWFERIASEQFHVFARKQADYGPGNIGMNGNTELALLGIGVRMNDKAQRILHILYNNEGKAHNESLLDSFKDISIYGIIAQIVADNKWGK